MSDSATTTETPVADNMVTIEIDGVETQAPKGSMIIEAADKMNISIPRFCYHRKLSIAANCRMCLVDVEKAPKPLPACATPVMDGMKVYTQSRRALSAQQNVMEFLLINHPLDCPICDQGGECELQDVSMGYGRSVSRFTERKRVVKDENIGPLISTEMTRCIHCTRCVRFLEEISGTSELGGIGRGEKTMISTFIGRNIDSELSGNIIDLCPVGALTNKPFRFKARSWEMRSSNSVAPHDCVGSNIHYHLRRGKILRAVPRDNEALNETWLSDRDRWGFMGLYHEDRATRPMIRDASGTLAEASWDDALAQAAGILRDGGSDTGYLVSPNATNEEMYLAQKIARSMGSESIDSRLRMRDFSGSTAPAFPTSLDALGAADCIILVGCNARQDYPIIGHRIRQASLKGAQVLRLGSFDYSVHYDLAHNELVRPSEMVASLQGGFGKAATAALKKAQRGVVLFGNAAQMHGQAGSLRAAAEQLATQTGAAFCAPGIGANAAGAAQAGALPGTDGKCVADMANGMSAYLIYGFEPAADTAYPRSLASQLKKTPTVYAGAFVTDAIREFADVILPLAVAPEVEGSLTALTGVVQNFGATGQAPGDARAGWKVLRVLGNELALDGFAYTNVGQVAADCAKQPLRDAPAGPAANGGEGALDIHWETAIYDVDPLVRRSAPLQSTSHAKDVQVVRMNAAEAGRYDLANDAVATFTIGKDTIRRKVVIDARVADGSCFLASGGDIEPAMKGEIDNDA